MVFIRLGGDLGLDLAMDRTEVVDIGHGIVVLVLGQQTQELGLLVLAAALADHHQVQVLATLFLHVRRYRPQLVACL